MANALQDGIFVWQKVAKALAGANPGVSQPFRELKTYIATQVGNPQLQFIPFTAEQIVTAGGFAALDVPGTLYAVYAKGRRTSGTTSSFFQVFAQANNTASTTLIVAGSRFKAVGQVFAAIYPTGLAIETAITLAADTTVAGDTESSAADAADGFIVIGA
jgi:hypothetical protein